MKFGTAGSMPHLNEQQVGVIKTAFEQHPDWDDLYLFYDGHVEGGNDFRNKFRVDSYSRSDTSRQAGINSINTDGIPVIVGRGHSQINMKRPQ